MCPVAVLINNVKLEGPFPFALLWSFLSTLQLLYSTAYQSFIAPMFGKLVLIPDGSLKKKIEEVAQQANFPLDKIFIAKGKMLQ